MDIYSSLENLYGKNTDAWGSEVILDIFADFRENFCIIQNAVPLISHLPRCVIPIRKIKGPPITGHFPIDAGKDPMVKIVYAPKRVLTWWPRPLSN